LPGAQRDGGEALEVVREALRERGGGDDAVAARALGGVERLVGGPHE
jgi:hypothetical protein